MTNTTNKVKYGLSNVYYAVYKGSGEQKYETPVPLEGAVNISIEPDGEVVPIYSDNAVAVELTNNRGYTGELELLIANDAFKQAVLGETVDANGVQTETSKAKPKIVALMFQFEGDAHEKRHLFYRCQFSRPTIGSSTIGDEIEPTNDVLAFTARARMSDNKIKSSVNNTTESKAIYDAWFDAVYDETAVI